MPQGRPALRDHEVNSMARMSMKPRKRNDSGTAQASASAGIPGQVVLVLQGGGALGAY